MNALQKALREKFGTPEKAIEALGLPPTLLATDESVDAGPLVTALRRSPKMAKLSSTAARVQAALVGLLGPHLAADAAIPDLSPALKGVTKANLGASRAKIWASAKAIVKPSLANDEAGPDDVAMRILDMIDKTSAAEPMEAEADQTTDENAGMGGEPAAAPPAKTVTDPNSAAPPMVKKPGEEEEAKDEGEEPDPAILKALMEKLGGNEQLARDCYGLMKGGATDEVVDPAMTETPATKTAVDKKAKDEAEAPMMKPAMDAAIAAALEKNRAEMRAEAKAAQEARAFVRPWVGEVAPAFDSAEEVHKATLTALGVSTKGVHPSAYRTIIEHLPKPGAGGRERLAHDSALSSGGRSESLAKMFPHAGSIRVMS